MTATLAATTLLLHNSARAASRTLNDRRVILITLDGLRWQEVFHGAEAGLMTHTKGDTASAQILRDEFWRDTPDERRRALLPFFWDTVAAKGQLIGDRDRGDDVHVTNGLKFSYPGYNELLTGAPDPRVDSNDKVPNPNINVLEWLNGRPGFEGKVAAFCSWDVFPYILNRERSGLAVQAGWEPVIGAPGDARRDTVNALFAGLHREWEHSAYDGLTFESAVTHLKTGDPRVLYIALGETDEFAHHDRYDFYLRAAHRADQQIRRIWDAVQSNPDWRDRTSLVLTSDHGRGDGDAWTSHGKAIDNAEYIWIGLLGLAIEPLPANAPSVRATQSQIAATVAALVGEDFRDAFPKAAPSLVPVWQ